MSTNIDDRIVAMRFDNKQFESAVSDSLETLENLKKSLDMEKAAKSFNDGMADTIKSVDTLNKKFKFDTAAEEFANLEEASKKITFADFGSALEAIKEKFSVFGTFADQVIRRVADGFVDLTNKATQLTKSLSIDQVSAGWSKYENELGYIQQMMNATGDSMDVIYEYVDQFDRFADETSYSSDELMKAAAQMLSMGGSIEEVLPMVEGIAVATAYAGKSNTEFAHTIRNITQSYGTGSLKAIDWKSVELMGVNTEQLTQSLIDYGVALGKIGKGEVTIGNFRDSLQKGWADTEVMEKAFGSWASTINQAFQMVDEGQFEFVADALDSLSQSMDDYTIKGALAAQTAKSFSEAVDATKDAVSTGWKRTFRILVGNLDEAKELWTYIVEEMLTIFAYPGDDRNEMLQSWKDIGGRETMLLGILNIWTNIKNVVSAVVDGFRKIFPKITTDRLLEMTNAFESFTEKIKLSGRALQNIKNTVANLTAAFRIVFDIASAIIKPLFGVGSATDGVVDGLTSVTSALTSVFRKLYESNAFKSFIEWFTKVSTSISNFTGSLAGGFGKAISTGIARFKLLREQIGAIPGALQASTGFIKDVITVLIDSFGELFNVDVSGFKEKFVGAFDKISEVLNNVWNIFSKVGGNIKDFFSNMKELFTHLGTESTGGGIFAGIGTLLGGSGSNIVKLLVDIISSVTGLEFEAGGAADKIVGFIDKIKNALSTAGLILDGFLLKLGNVGFSSLSNFWDNMKTDVFSGAAYEEGGKGLGGVTEAGFDTLANIVRLFSDFFGGMTGLETSGTTEKVVNVIFKVRDAFVSVADGIETAWSKMKEVLSPIFTWLKDSAKKIGDALGQMFGIKPVEEEFDPTDISMFSSAEQSELKTRMDAEGIGPDTSLGGKIKQKFKPLINALNWVSESFDKLKQDLEPKMTAFKEWFNTTTDGMFESGEKFYEKVKEKFQPLIDFFVSVGGLLKAIWDRLKPVIDALLTFVTDKIKTLTDSINGSDINIGAAVAGGGAIAAIVLIVKKLAGLGSDLAGGSIIDKICEKLQALTDTLEELQTKLRAGAIKDIAIAIGILSLSMLALSFANPEGIGGAIGGLMTIFGGLLLVITVMGEIDFQNSGKDIQKMGTALLLMSVGVGVICLAMTALAKVAATADVDKLALTMVELIMGMVLGMMVLAKGTEDADNILKAAAGLFVVATAMKRMTKVVMVFANLSPDQFEQAIKGVGLLMGMMTLLALAMTRLNDSKANKASKETKSNSTAIIQLGTAILEIAAALLIIVIAVKMLADIPTDQMKAGFLALGASLLAVTAALALLAILSKKMEIDGAEFMKIAASIGIVAVAMLAIAGAIAMMDGLEHAWRGFGILALMLVAIGAVMVLLKKFISDTSDILKIAGSLVLASAALLVIAAAIAIVAQIDFKQLVAAGVALSVIFAELAGALLLLSKNSNPTKLVGTAGALILVTAALMVIAIALKLVASIELSSMLLSMFSLVVMVGLLTLALGLLASVADPKKLAGTAGALILATVAVLGIATALLMLSQIPADQLMASMLALSVVLGILAVALGVLAYFFDPKTLLAVGAAFALMGAAVALVGIGFNQMCEGLAQLIVLGPEGLAMVMIFVDYLIAQIPAMIGAFARGLFIELPKVLLEALPELTKTMFEVIKSLLEVFVQTIPMAIETLWTFITALLDSILENIKGIITTIGHIIIAILEGLIQVIYPIVTKLIELVCEIIRAVGDRLSLILSTLVDFVISLLNALAETIENKAVALYNAIKRLVKSIFVAIVNIGMAMIGDIKKLGQKVMQSGFIQGIQDKFAALKLKVREFIQKPIDIVKEKIEDIKQAARDFFDGFLGIIPEKIRAVAEKVREFGNTALQTLKNVFNINSPSKETRDIGLNFGAGLELGIGDSTSMVQDAASGLGESALTSLTDSMGSAMLEATQFVDDEDLSPTITPVLDLSEIQNGTGAMADMLNFDDPSLMSGLNLGSYSGNMFSNIGGSSSSYGGTSTIVNQPINFTINAAPGQDVNSIAAAVERMLTKNTNQREYAFR